MKRIDILQVEEKIRNFKNGLGIKKVGEKGNS